jgi:formylglycine-generating enzyme required for sulfatase activity
MHRFTRRFLMTTGGVIAFAAALAVPLPAFQAVAPGTARTPKAGETKLNSKDGLKYVWIPAGDFTSGCSPHDDQCYDDELPTRHIILTKGFWLGVTEVPQAAYERVMGKNPSTYEGPTLPVEEVRWWDADDYCAAIGGRLPTEAEWEYAARAGSTESRYGDIDKVAWYSGNSNFTPHPVGQKLPNAFGLYDMLGNVIEWTNTYFTVQISQENVNPQGPKEAEYRTLRGGGWFDDPELVRASDRDWFEDGDTDYNVGFRCVSN